MRTISFPGVVLCILFASCQQEVGEIINQAQQCRIQTGYYYGGSGGVNDSARFIYDGSGKLVKIANRDGYYLYTYQGDKINTRKFIDSITSEVLFLDSVWYDGSGNISKFVARDYSGWFSDSIAITYLLKYQNSRLTDLDYIESYREWTGNMVSDTFPAKFTWDAAGNNIEKLVYYDSFGAFDSIRYQYDANPNYFKIVHPHFFLLDPMFQLHVGLEAHFGYFYSKNNVVNTNIYGSWDNPITYGHDSTNKLTSVDMAGFDYMKYKYQCQ